MKKLTLLSVVCAALAVCGCDQVAGRQAVRAAYPHADIADVPNHHYEYIVRDTNGNIYWVNDDGTYGTSTSGASSVLLFYPK